MENATIMKHEYHGKIVHTIGSGRHGVAQGLICQTCPGGCKTDCLRDGVVWEYTRLGSIDYTKNFSDVQQASEGLENEEY